MTKKELFEQCEKHYNDSFTKPLNHCQAEYTDLVYFDDSTPWIILRSYSTIVAAYSWTSGTVYVRDYYSATTVQHVYKFIDRINTIYGTSRVAYLYKRSDNIVVKYYQIAGKPYHKWSEFHDLAERDYKPIITVYENY